MPRFLKLIFAPVILLGFLLFSAEVKSQELDSLNQKFKDLSDYLLYRNHDSTYISNYGEEVSARLVVVTKYNYFQIRDKVNNTKIRYRPIRGLSLGVGATYKWFSVDLTFALNLNNSEEFANTRALDLSGNIFSSKQLISFTLLYYQAYELSNLSGVNVAINEASKRREDIRTINVGLQYQYAFNYTKFSMKAPFIFNEVQIKSAGSPILGASFNMFTMDSDSSIIPEDASDFFVANANMDDLNVLSLSVSFGYMYTFVIKRHFFLTLSLMPGLSINGGDYNTASRNYLSPNLNFKLGSMNAIGYNGRRLYVGFNFITESLYVQLDKKLIAKIGHGKGKFFIGYRFGKKIK